jgi:hypothetical protein
VVVARVSNDERSVGLVQQKSLGCLAGDRTPIPAVL